MARTRTAASLKVGLATVLVVGAIAPGPARADLEVGSAPGFGLLLDQEGTNGWRAIIEHFADSTRNGMRVRQIGVGDPRIYSDSGDICFTNALANDVVCNDQNPFIQTLIDSSDNAARNELVIGGSNSGCEPGPPARVFVTLGGGDDVVRPRYACGGQENPPGDNRFSPQFDGTNGGSGNDSLTLGRLADRVFGGTGNDTINGDTGADELNGDDGNDTIRGQGGADTLLGGAGADLLDGGGQVDSVTYATSSAVTLTIDGTANDGRSGENDNVINVETIVTGSGNDRVTGSADAETLEGGAGDDVLNPGAGADVVRGQAGADIIDVRESNEVVQDQVTCGTGFDQVIADLVDSVRVTFSLLTQAKDDTCERVERFAVDDGPPGRIRARSVTIAHDGGVAIPLGCPRRARVTCAGTLRLADPLRPRRTLAKARYEVPRRTTESVGLDLTRGDARRVRKRGAIRVVTRERGVSRKGPRSSIALLRVRAG